MESLEEILKKAKEAGADESDEEEIIRYFRMRQEMKNKQRKGSSDSDRSDGDESEKSQEKEPEIVVKLTPEDKAEILRLSD